MTQAMRLDEKGRCCGRKPIVYKTERGPRYPRGHFCYRCGRSFNLETREQQENWAWKRDGDGFREREP